MSIKKILKSFVIAALFVTTLCGSMLTAYAAENSSPETSVAAEDGTLKASSETGGLVKVTVSDASATAGQEVKVSLSMTGKKIVSFEGTLIYDTDALSVVNIVGTDKLSANGMTMFEQDEETDEFKSGRFVYASPIGEDLDGTVLEFTFKTNAGDGGKYDFSLEDLIVYEYSGTVPIMCETEITNSGSITVGGSSPLLLIILLLVLVAAAAVVVVLIRRKKMQSQRSAYRANGSNQE